VEKQDGYSLVLWQQISTFHQQFLPYILNGQLSSPEDVCLHFSVIGCFWTSQYFPSKSFDYDIFLSNGIFGWHWKAFFLHYYCSIKDALIQYQILLKEVMLNQKVVKPLVYLANCLWNFSSEILVNKMTYFRKKIHFQRLLKICAKY